MLTADKLEKQLDWIQTALTTNLKCSLEYGSSFWSQVIGMFVNDSLWVFFWVIYFERFPVLNGWTREDVILLWAVITFSFGIAFGIFAQALRLSELISNGQLDFYLALPKNVLLQILLGQVRPVNLGDLVFGPVLLLFFTQLSFLQVMAYLFSALCAAMIYLAFFIIAGSLAFYFGSSDGLSAAVGNGLIHFSTYPTRIFEGWTRVLLFTVIPAGYISEVPVEFIKDLKFERLFTLLTATGIFLGLAGIIFSYGLRKYESGNLMSLRS